MAVQTKSFSRQYYRNGPPHRGGADVSFADLVKVFGFNSIHIGRWVSTTEQQQAANLFFDAFCDLQHILQVPAEVISLRQTLALSFGIGGQKGVCAHYQPSGRTLALAKNAGGGSLAHEWFHAFDHYIAQKMFSLEVPRNQFSSRSYLLDLPIKTHYLNALLAKSFNILFLSTDCNAPSELFSRCRRFDAENRINYYAQPEEMAARAFEKMLQQQSVKNSFLVAGTLQGRAARAGLYPDDTLSRQLTDIWLTYFAQLGQMLGHKSEQSRANLPAAVMSPDNAL